MLSLLRQPLFNAAFRNCAAIRAPFSGSGLQSQPSIQPSPSTQPPPSTQSSSSVQAVCSWRNQKTIRIYRIATLKKESRVDEAVEKALKYVWPQVMEYAAQNTVTGEIWAQIRSFFHRSGSINSPSYSPHATIRLYDETLKHVGGVHAPENPREEATFKGGLQKISYHGEKKSRFAFTVRIFS